MARFNKFQSPDYQLGYRDEGMGAYKAHVDQARRQFVATNAPDMYDTTEDHRMALIESGFADPLLGDDQYAKRLREMYDISAPAQDDMAGQGLEAAKRAYQQKVKQDYTAVMSAFGGEDAYRLQLEKMPAENRPRDWTEANEMVTTFQIQTPETPMSSPGGLPQEGYEAFSGISDPGEPSLGQMSMEPSDRPQRQMAGSGSISPTEPVEDSSLFSLGRFEEPIERGLQGFAGRVGDTMMPRDEYERTFEQYAPYTLQAYGMGPDRPKAWEQPSMSMPPEEADPSLLSSSSMQDLYAPMSMVQEAAPQGAMPTRYPAPPPPPPMLPMSPEGQGENPLLRQAIDRIKSQPPVPADSIGEVGSAGFGRIPFMGTSLPASMMMGTMRSPEAEGSDPTSYYGDGPAGTDEFGVTSEGVQDIFGAPSSQMPYYSRGSTDGLYPMANQRDVPPIAAGELQQLKDDEGGFEFQSTVKRHKRVTGEPYSAEVSDDGTKIYWAYKDSVGLETIGHGFNLRKKGAASALMNAGISKSVDDLKSGKESITENEAELLLNSELSHFEELAEKWVGSDTWNKLTDDRKRVIFNMAFNMGGNAFTIKSLPKLLSKAVNSQLQEDYDAVAKRMMEYKWSKQVKDRAFRLSERMRGRNPFARESYMEMAEGGVPEFDTGDTGSNATNLQLRL